MEAILKRLLLPDNEVIKAATQDLKNAFKSPGVIPELCTVLTQSQELQIRQYAAVLLRKKFAKSASWMKFSEADRTMLKTGCLTALENEPEAMVRNSLAQLVATLAKHEMSATGVVGWPELMTLVQGKLASGDSKDRVLGAMMASVLCEVAGEQIAGSLKEFLTLFSKTLADSEMEVAFFTIVALTHLVKRTGSDEVALFQQLMPSVLGKIEQIAGVSQEKAMEAIDIFDELIESEVSIVVPHIKPMVELCLKISQDQGGNVEDGLKIKAISFMGQLTRLKKKTIVKHKLYIPMIQVIFEVMVTKDLEDDDDDAEEEDDTPQLAASQTLDLLALNLPPEKYISTLLSHVQPALENPSPQYQRAAYEAIAVSAEGCQEHIRNKYLQNFLAIMARGIRHEVPVVRNAALYMLGQFSEYIQPEISNHAADILPVLLDYLDQAFASMTPGGEDPSTVSRIYYALESFCENLEKKLNPHLEAIMPRIVNVLQKGSPPFSIRVHELSLSLVAAVANASKGAISPYLEVIWPCLERLLSAQHTQETEVLLIQSMATLGTIARAVGQENFSREFSEKCLNIGMELVQNNDNPEIRKCAYALFGAVASVVKEEMATVIGPCVGLMLKSIQSTEGITLEVGDGYAEGLPLEELSDEEDLTDEDSQDTADLEDVKALTVQNEYISEKEFAVSALKDFSVECGVAFYPFLTEAAQEVSTLLDYPENDVRCAAIEAMAYFYIAYYKSGNEEGLAMFKKGAEQFLLSLCDTVIEEEDNQVVIASLDALTELLKQTKSGATEIPGIVERIVGCVKNIMKGECACQDVEEAEGGDEGDEEAEQDELLFEYAGEVLPNLGKALTPLAFAPYFTSLLPMLLKKTKKHCSIAERSFAVGAIAESIEPLSTALGPFLQHLLPLFTEMVKDEEDDCRHNAIFGLGELVYWAGDVAVPHYNAILGTLSALLGQEKSARVIDQIVGAVCRIVIANVTKVPVEELTKATLENLPLKDDLDEYDYVFKFFMTLYSAGHAVIGMCLPKIVECSLAFINSPETDKPKTTPLVSQTLKSVSSSFPAEFNALVGALAPDQVQIINQLIQA